MVWGAFDWELAQAVGPGGSGVTVYARLRPESREKVTVRLLRGRFHMRANRPGAKLRQGKPLRRDKGAPSSKGGGPRAAYLFYKNRGSPTFPLGTMPHVTT